MVAVLFISLVALMFVGVPIAASIGFASLASMIAGGSTTLYLVAQKMVTALDSTTLIAIPLFVLAGAIMGKGGISKRIIDLSYEIFGWIPGSLGIVTVVACMFFAALSGSSPATVAAIGGIMVPAMIEDGYPAGYSAAIAASGGIIGCIIPPSIPFVNYGLITGVSVGDLFAGGIVPGILMGVALCVIVSIQATRNHWGSRTHGINGKKVLAALKSSVLALLMPVIILGGIYGGFFTPTEAAGVACVYGMVVACLIYRTVQFRNLMDIAFDGVLTSSMIMFIVAAANAFSNIITTQQVPAMLSALVLSITDNKNIVLLLINIMLLINGCFMEETATTYIYTPILFPLITSLGVNPVQFGVIMVMNMTMGLITPPLGINLFVATSLDPRVKLSNQIKYIMPLFLVLCAVLMLVTYIPSISLCMVNLIGGGV
ncbi:C4-dicarboxylate TRAP transporter large permease protein DctM [bioreactor metagenome]|uniref:C4-dicarboxylate TRAP transporter large permease protein DctM n=1 Tax=bioreactor metagenome TaxID=1076179 RepID=A0A644Y8Y2_9ZZZZ